MNFTPDTASSIGMNAILGNSLLMQFYPNPASSTINTDYMGSLAGGEKMMIHNMSGELVFQTNLQSNIQFEVGNWKSGNYVYQVIDKNKKLLAQGNLVVQH